jgi:pSer/pThr/pTyr-binding forkhead associated (FHA) protein
VTLEEGEHVLGRDPDAGIYLDSPGISRRHALIKVSPREATIEDLGSKNGTRYQDRLIERITPLHDGDSIRLGSITLTFSFVHALGSTETEHAPDG